MTTILILGGLALAAAVAVAFWEQIVQWAHASLFPWFEKHLPTLAPYVRDAFVFIDKAAMALRKTVIEAWRKVRPTVLKVLETFERSENAYILKVTSWLRDHLEEKQVKYHETERTVSMDDLPEDVREAFMRGSRPANWPVFFWPSGRPCLLSVFEPSC